MRHRYQKSFLEKAIAVTIHPSIIIDRVMRLCSFLPFTTRMYFDGFKKPAYAYGVWRAASLAFSLSIPEISVIEFGVAQGDGFRELQYISKEVEKVFPLKIHVIGFDTGEGLPLVSDYRDMPYYWQTSDFQLAGDKIKGVLYGDVADTLNEFNGPPFGFISFDLDLYSSTKSAFAIFKTHPHLPRVICYFDDTIGSPADCNEYTGELLAIREFNDAHHDEKIAPINGFSESWFTRGIWTKGIYVYHDFKHPAYTTYIGS